ncbi:MAG: alkaline phosphatase family protein [Rhizobiales bacterium]|nr:alkaline phosphatase family protein [Hyphomicrobiales bacterium]
MSFRSKILLAVAGAALCAALGLQLGTAQAQAPRNLILFVPDGLRALMVTPQTAPTMAAIRDQGVNFANPHSLFPTFTTANASAMATGHYLGDTGDFSNTIYTGYPVAPAGGTVTPFLENDAVLFDVDEHFGGDYLNEETILKAARRAGLSTAAIGKLGPTLIFDHTDRADRPGRHTIVIDDSTGRKDGAPLSPEMQAALSKAGLPVIAPTRGDNGKAGKFNEPGTSVANVEQQKYFVEVATQIVLPMFKARNKPFVLVFWSRDPDGSQHNQGDSLNALTPGINGPTSLAAIKNADDNLAQLRKALDELGLAATTNIVIAADHGFSTISKQSQTSPAAKADYTDVPKGLLPPGFLAIDLAKALGLPLFDPNEKNAPVPDNVHTKFGSGVIGKNPAKPDIVVAANGGSDLIYLPGKNRRLAAQVVKALLEQDYVSGIFVDASLGRYAGTLPMSAINLSGSARPPHPSIVVNFTSFAAGCAQPVLCAAVVADTALQQGQGMHGSFSRADTMNFMAAVGPDFKAGFVNKAPVSNADVGKTIAHVLRLRIKANGRLIGRVLREALPGGRMPAVRNHTLRSAKAANGLQTMLKLQSVGATRYFDAAGFPGRTVGLDEAPKSASR